MVVAKLLPYDTHLPPTGHSAFTRKVHELLPVSLQHSLRDRHLGPWLDRAVGASAVALAVRHPKTFVRFLGLKRRGQVFQYGHESAEQTVEIHRCGKEYLTKNVEINVPCRGTKTGGDWSMVCEGTLHLDRETSTAIINP